MQVSDNIHIEKFLVDIEKFIKEGIKEKREIYAMFSQEDRGNIVFLTNHK